MKLVITVTLLALCAITKGSANLFDDILKVDYVEYNLVPRNQIITNYGLAESINAFIIEKIDEANLLIEKFNNFSDDIQDEATDIINDATNTIEYFVQSSAIKINKLKELGGIYKKCAENFESELKQIRSNSLENAVNCVKNVVVALKEFAAEVSKEALQLTRTVVELVSIVKECYEKDGTIATTKCAFQKIKEIKEIIPRIVSGISSTIATVTTQANAVVASVQNCKQSEITNIGAIFKSFDNKIIKCYDN